MAVLLVGLAIMSVMLSVAMPVWHQMMQREKEEELIFRGMQYARAINLYQRKFPGAFPPSIDALLEQKVLRKKYKDPMVPDGEFQLVPAAATGQAGMASGLQQINPQTGRQQLNPQSRVSTGSTVSPSTSTFGSSSSSGAGLSGTYVGPFSGVVSKSKEKSIKIYNGKDHYNEWLFVYASSAAAGGRGMRGGPRGQGPGRGQDVGPGTMPFGAGQGRGRGGRGMGPGGGTSFDQFQMPMGPGRGRGQ